MDGGSTPEASGANPLIGHVDEHPRVGELVPNPLRCGTNLPPPVGRHRKLEHDCRIRARVQLAIAPPISGGAAVDLASEFASEDKLPELLESSPVFWLDQV